MPLAYAQCDICRNDLLFELEAEAEMMGAAKKHCV